MIRSFAIEADDAQRLIEAYDRHGRDPLQLRKRCRDTWRDVARFCGEILAGRQPVADELPTSRLDIVAAHLLAWQGINPHVAAAVAEAAGGIGILVDGQKGDASIILKCTTSTDSTMDGSSIGIPPILWKNGRLRVPRLPDTIVAAVEGMEDSPPLSDILVHPALGGLELHVYGMANDDRTDETVMHLDNPIGPLTREELAEVWSRWT